MKKLNSIYESSFSKFRVSVQNSLGSKSGLSVVKKMGIRLGMEQDQNVLVMRG